MAVSRIGIFLSRTECDGFLRTILNAGEAIFTGSFALNTFARQGIVPARAYLYTDSTADTADVTLLLCFCTFFLIGTFYHNVVCTLMDMDHFLWADFRTGATANAFLLIHFRHTILIDGNGSEFTFIYTGFTSDTSICTAGLTFG